MNKTILSALSVLTFTASTLAQVHQHQFDPTNARDGETVEYCHSHTKAAEILANPDAAASFAQDEIIRQQEAANGVAVPKAPVYYIPVVFHVLHNNGVEDISDDQILDAMEIINRDYRLQNNDANNVHPDFQGMPSDVEIEFRLATKAPDGTCFSGITRTVHPLTNDGSNGIAQVNAIISGNDVYNGEWPGDEYMNIFVCGEIGGAAGYTYTPSNWIGSGMGNGIWVLHNYVGSIGTSSTFTSRTLTHEAGHWLNLDHPWGGNNNPGNASSCSTDDGVSDTPNTIGVTSCNLNEMTCGPRANVENYMDYSYCSKMFTQGQVTRMRNALTSNIANRDNLITASNHQNTGINGNAYLCKAEFEASRTSICAGDAIDFTDMSFNQVTGWTWTFPGGTPASSTSQDPTVTYNTPGIYNVTLTATDGSNTETTTKSSYIRVLPAGVELPIHEGFEDFSTLTNVPEWEIFNPSGNGWQLASNVGHQSSKSAKLTNFGQSAGNTDELISNPVDLSTVDASEAITLSFRYAYAMRYASNDEWLKVFITPNCGENWAQRKTLHGTQLTDIVQNSSYTPAADEWITVHMTNVTSNFFSDKFRYKFEFESDGGNNFYLDNINIYKGSPSDDIVSVTESNLDIESLSVYPNPTDGDLNIRFAVANAQGAQLNIQDLSGKVIQSSYVQANAGSNWVMMGTQDLSSGMYFLNVQVGATQQTIQFVVK